MGTSTDTKAVTSTYASPRVGLVVPASDQHKLAKALAAEVDEVVLDLEDAVAPQAKNVARRHVTDALAASPRPVAIRINQIGTPWCHQDVLAIAGAVTGPVTIVVPKVEHPADVGFVERLLTGALAERAERAPHVALDVLVETAAALSNLDEILEAGPRIRAVVVGYADLSADLGRPASTDPTLWDGVRHQVVTAARAAGRAAIDGPWLGTAADEAFLRDRERAAALGFDGSWVIHPQQVEAAVRLFTPSAEQIAWAERVVSALAEAVERGVGAVAVDGLMLDEALAVRARAVLDRAGRSA